MQVTSIMSSVCPFPAASPASSPGIQKQIGNRELFLAHFIGVRDSLSVSGFGQDCYDASNEFIRRVPNRKSNEAEACRSERVGAVSMNLTQPNRHNLVVYIASMFADKDRVAMRAKELESVGIGCTSRWANLSYRHCAALLLVPIVTYNLSQQIPNRKSNEAEARRSERVGAMKVYIASMFSDKDRVAARAEELAFLGISCTSRWAHETIPHNVTMADCKDEYLRETLATSIKAEAK